MSSVDVSAPLRPLWLSHHYACDVDRCVHIGGRRICRRCLAMFTGFFAALALHIVVSFEAQIGDIGLVLGVSAFAAYEFVQVVRGQMAYSARRVLLVSPFVGVVLAWLAVTGFRGGLGPAHIALGLVALGLATVLLANGTVVRRAQHSR